MEARSRAGSGDCMMQCSSEAWAFWEEGRERWPGGGVKRGEGGKEKNEEVEGLQHTLHNHVHEESIGNIFRELKNRQPPGIEPGPLTLAVSALPPELWPPGDSQPSQFSISLCMYCQNPARDRPVTPLHQGRSHTE